MQEWKLYKHEAGANTEDADVNEPREALGIPSFYTR